MLYKGKSEGKNGKADENEKKNRPNRRVWQMFSEAQDLERTAMELMQCATSCDGKIDQKK